MTKKPQPTKPITVRQAAAQLFGDDGPTSTRRVQRLIASEELAAHKLPGKTGAWLVEPESLEAYQEKRRQADPLA